MISPIRQQVLEAIEQTPDLDLEKILDFLKTLNTNIQPSSQPSVLIDYEEKIRQWETIPDDVAMQIKAEFSQEDFAIAEFSVTNFAQFAQATES
ncbi:MAG: hypothetical protein VKJ24_09385 [Synechococcales bacterium]|nr:hypothetical protein [Synechococcales bacterium]